MGYQITVDTPGLLAAMREKDLPLNHALLELIDNSVDAGAKSIRITDTTDDDLEISDDGSGFADLSEAVTLGNSSKASGQIGRYGIGLKDAVLRYSNATVVRSRGKSIRVPWLDIILYRVPPETPDVEDAQDDGRTVLVLEGYKERAKGRPRNVPEICRTYWPLLKSGSLTIEWNGQPFTATPLPAFTKAIDVSFDFRGKKVRLCGGIYKPNDPQHELWKGYNIFYNGRLIGPGRITDVGVGDEGCTAFSFIVHLIDGEESWDLSTNKTQVEDADELLAHCYDDYTRPLLIEGAEQSTEVELKDIEDIVNEAGKSDCRGNRTQGPIVNHSGSAKETGDGPKKKRTFTKTRPGEYVAGPDKSHKRKSYDFKFTTLAGERLGELTAGRSRPIITLNLGNAFVAKHRRCAATILGLTMSAYGQYQTALRENLEFGAVSIVNASLAEIGSELHAKADKVCETKG